MKYLSALILVSFLFSCKTNVLNEEKSFRVDNGQFSFSASKEKFQLADFKVGEEVVSVIDSLEDQLIVNPLVEVNWRPFKPLHDSFTLIYNQSADEPNLKFTRSIYVDQKKSQVKIRYNLKNRSKDKAISYEWTLRSQVAKEIKSEAGLFNLSLSDKNSQVSFKSDKAIESLTKGGVSSLYLKKGEKPLRLAPLNRISWQVTLDIKSLKKKPWWKIL